MTEGKHVAILMASHNGAAFIRDQLQSILMQDHADWSLWISDDGSEDDTRRIVDEFRMAHPERPITLRDGPRAGSMTNFMSLIGDQNIAADYVAIADQDDVWLPKKLSRALALVTRQEGQPVLYGGRTIIVSETLTRLGMSPLFRRALGFRNALVQSFAGGNTMLMNRAARELVIRGGDGAGAVCHDWWLYQLVSGAGGHVIYDAEPMVLYRQHDGNQIGSNNSLKAKIDRVGALLHGRYRIWNGRNIGALRSVAGMLTPENRQVLDSFEQLREARGPRALALLNATGLYRQTHAGNISLALASLIGCL